jgi:hypothetical protein
MKKFLVTALLLVLVFSVVGCGGGGDGDGTPTTATVIFINDTTFAIEIQENSIILLDLDSQGATGSISVSPGAHNYIAYVSGTATVVNAYSITAVAGETYTINVQVII